MPPSLAQVRSWLGPRPTFLQFTNLFEQTLAYVWTQTWFKLLLGRVGPRSIIMGARLGGNGRAIFIGADVMVRWSTRLEAIPRFAGRDLNPHLEIGDNTNIEQGCHIMCGGKIVIGSNVSITPGCAIIDITHPFDTSDQKIGTAPINLDPIEIGDGAFLGNNVSVLPGTRIGKYVVVGANSVVQGILPDYTVWAGNPARCILRYDRSNSM